MPNIAPPRFKTGTHVLVIGVSRYPYASGPDATSLGLEYGIGDVSCAARSASLFAAFMLNEAHNPDAPLVSLRVLLSPSDGEQLEPTIEKALGKADFAATRTNVEGELDSFVEECATDPGGVVVVYVVGHGMQLGGDGAVVYLQDLGKNGKDDLWGAIDLEAWHKGMNVAGMPARQVWFVDACRQDAPRMIDGLGGALSRTTRRGSRVEVSLMFLAASTGEAAFAKREVHTYFCESLLWALRGAGAVGGEGPDETWFVGARQLSYVLPKRVEQTAAALGLRQRVDSSGNLGEVVLHWLDKPPITTITLKLVPSDHAPQPEVELRYKGQTAVKSALPFPIAAIGPAGLYLLVNQATKHTDLFVASPDQFTWPVRAT